jgi:hypothetical protein
MEYKISRHAQTEMERRNISLSQVESVLNNPQQILQKKGTGNREQIRNTHLHQFKAQSKKTVSLSQSHVFKHEFFLLESCPFPVPSESKEKD